MSTDLHTPVVKTARLALSPQEAFDRFTAGIHLWWPLGDRFSVGKENSETVVFGKGVGQHIEEQFKDGGSTVWGTVLIWDPPTVLRFTWHPGNPPSDNMQVQVTFMPVEGGTEVELTHVGWENLGDRGAEVKAGYEGGWVVVFGRFASV